MKHEFTLRHAEAAVRQGQLGRFLDAFLTVHNTGLRDGLKKKVRYWYGPQLTPLSQLVRCCGPEAGMEYPMPPEDWDRRVRKITDSFASLELFPPLIANRVGEAWVLRDGNTRHEAFRRLNIGAAWVFFWLETPESAAEVGFAPDQAVVLG